MRSHEKKIMVVFYTCACWVRCLWIHLINLLTLFKLSYLHLIQLHECCGGSVHIPFNVQSHIFFSPRPFARKQLCICCLQNNRTIPNITKPDVCDTHVILLRFILSYRLYHLLKVQSWYSNTHPLLGGSTISSLKHQWLRATVFIPDTDNILTNIGRNRNTDVMSRRCFDLDAITSYHYTIH